MAYVVGVLLIVLCLVGVPLSNFDGTPLWGVDFLKTPNWFDEGSSAEKAGEFITGWLGTFHGWLYMIFLVMAFSLSRKAKWTMGYTIGILIAGTVPVLSFWSEHKASTRIKKDFPEEFAA